MYLKDPLIVSHGRNESIKFWSVNGELVHSFRTDHMGFCKCCVKGSLIAVPSEMSGTLVYDVEHLTQPKQIFNFKPPTNEGALMAIDLINNIPIIAYECGSIWKLDSVPKQARTEDMPTCLAFNSEIQDLLVGTSSNKIFIFNQNLERKHEIELTNPGLNGIAVRPDGKIYATIGWDLRIRVFSSKSHKKLCVLQMHEDTLNSIMFTSGENNRSRYLLVAASSDALISVWDMYNQQA